MKKLDYGILVAVLSALYLILKQFLPDFPVGLDVLVVAIGYGLAKLGIEIVNKPAESIRKLFGK